LSTLKVYQLARELGVDSKSIIAKCKKEEVPNVDSHLSAVKTGLAVTIREWFSAGAPKTAVEKTAHVDVAEVRRKRTTKSKSSAKDSDSAGSSETEASVAVMEPEPATESLPHEVSGIETSDASELSADVEHGASVLPAQDVSEVTPAKIETPTAKKRTKAAEPHVQPEEAAVSEPDISVAPPAPPAKAVTPEIPQKPVKPTTPVTPRGVPNVVARPVVTAVGPKNIPAPAQMQGPRLIRVETPEPVRQIRPRSRPAAPFTPGAPRGDVMPPPPTNNTRHRKSGFTTAPRVDDEEAEAKRKGRLGRRGHGQDVDAGLEQIREWTEAEIAERAERIAAAGQGALRERRREAKQNQQKRQNAALHHTQRPTHIEVVAPITIRQLSQAMGVQAGKLLSKLLAQSIIVTVNQTIEDDVAQLLAAENGVELVIKQRESLLQVMIRKYAERKTTAPTEGRAPVVTVLGHVDHGKTSLLDKIRSANVAAGEAGGITQHIGAYTVKINGSDGKTKRVTFLDTPGHQAFTAMRARGANMTDVVVLVVAADDGVMPQTVESINHAKAAGVPIVVALNKIDKPDARPDRVLGQLAENGLNPSEWGGETEVVRTSAATGQGVRELIEYLDYVASLRELKASPTLPASGRVVEAFMDPNRGAVARVLVQDGTLRIGDALVCGATSGRVRSMSDDKNQPITEAGPATPIEVIGLDAAPSAGESFYVIDDISQAKAIAEEQAVAVRESEIARRNKVTLDNLFDTIKLGEVRELNIILKADVQGSVDVLRKVVTEELSKEVQVKLLHAAVGGITESDVLLADASGAMIIGFSVTPDESARKLAERNGVEIRLYRIIYEISDDIRKALAGMLSPEKQEQIVGRGEIRKVIRVTKIGSIAGCMVTDGILNRSNKYRLIRDGVVVVGNLALDSLKRFKDDIKEVRSGMECGLKLAGYDDIKVGDRLEAYKTVDVARTL